MTIDQKVEDIKKQGAEYIGINYADCQIWKLQDKRYLVNKQGIVSFQYNYKEVKLCQKQI